jgi:hypothetical protein
MKVEFPNNTKVVDLQAFAKRRNQRLRAVPSKPRPVPPMPPSAA